MKRTKREQDRIKDLAREYKTKGFQVWVEPNQTELPVFLQGLNYVPDLLVKSDTENIIIEVKSSESIKDARYLEKITQLIQSQKEWEFELVLTNPKKSDKIQTSFSQDYQSIKSAFERAKKLLLQDTETEYIDAAFLLAWSGFESVTRLALTQAKSDMKVVSPRDLIRNIVIAGLINRDDFDFLQEILNQRNALVHGNFSISIKKADVLHLIEIGDSLLNDN